jgi:hypothetical protein
MQRHGYVLCLCVYNVLQSRATTRATAAGHQMDHLSQQGCAGSCRGGVVVVVVISVGLARRAGQRSTSSGINPEAPPRKK